MEDRELRIEDGESNHQTRSLTSIVDSLSSILDSLSSILDSRSSILDSQAEGERVELSQAEARRFSGPVHCQLCEPSAKREQEESNLHQRFWRPPCCQLHHAPLVA